MDTAILCQILFLGEKINANYNDGTLKLSVSKKAATKTPPKKKLNCLIAVLDLISIKRVFKNPLLFLKTPIIEIMKNILFQIAVFFSLTLTSCPSTIL